MNRMWPLLFAGICLAVFAFCRSVTPARPAPCHNAPRQERFPEQLPEEMPFDHPWHPPDGMGRNQSMREQGFIQLPGCMVPESGPGSDGWWRGGGSP